MSSINRRAISKKDKDYHGIHQRFEDAYGPTHILHRESPTLAGETVLDCLIATLLTQATNDKNALKAYLNLKRIHPRWETVIGLTEEELAMIILCAGLARGKAKHILELLKRIEIDQGSLTLDPLQNASPEAARAYLVGLPGVGSKTAACVQAFALNQAAFPVDTHVHRILKRWGWVEPRTTPEQAQKLMEECIPKTLQSNFHVYLIHHGRTICRASNPRCSECLMADTCRRIGL